MGDLVQAKKIFFFFKPLVIESSSPTNNGVRFFFRIISHERYFFSVFFPQVFPYKNFFSSKSVCKIFFFQKSPIPPFKSETVSPLVGEGYGCPQSDWCLYLPIEEKTMSLWVFYYLHLTSSLLQFTPSLCCLSPLGAIQYWLTLSRPHYCLIVRIYPY